MKRVVFLLQETVSSILTNRGNLLIGIVTTAFTIACFGVFFLLYLNLKNLAGSLQEDIEVIVYLDEGLSSAKMRNLGKQLKAEPEVASLTFVSRRDALKDFHRLFPEESSLLDVLGENPLPASFVLKLARGFQTPDSVVAFVERLQGYSGVEFVRYSREWIETLSILVRYFELGALVIGAILAMATVTIIGNTIRLSFYVRKEEIEILRLIGATGAFIATPYVLEGAVLGGLGGGLSLLLLKGSYEYFRLEVDASGWFQGFESVLEFFPFQVSISLVLAGLMLGAVSSFLSIFGLMRAKGT